MFHNVNQTIKLGNVFSTLTLESNNKLHKHIDK